MKKTIEEMIQISKKKKGNKDYIEGWNDAIHTANRLNGEIEAYACPEVQERVDYL